MTESKPWDAFYRIAKRAQSRIGTENTLTPLLADALDLLGADIGSINSVNPKSGKLESIVSIGSVPNLDMDLSAVEATHNIAIRSAHTGIPSFLSTASQGKANASEPEPPLSEAASPIEIDGQLRGSIYVGSYRQNVFGEETLPLLKELSDIAGSALQANWLIEQQRRKARFFEGLVRISQAINSTLDLQETLSIVTREACELLGGKMCAALIVDDRGFEWLKVQAYHGAGEAYLRRGRIRVDETLMGIVLRKSRPIQIEDVQDSPLYQHTDLAKTEGLRSLLSAPLQFNGIVSGALNLYTDTPHPFSNEEIQSFVTLAELSAIAIHKAKILQDNEELEGSLRQNERLSALGLLAAEVAHEIRNPLTVMNMLFHSLDLQFPDNDPRNEDARILIEKMGGLNQTVERILKFAKNSEPKFRKVDINKVLEDLFQLLRLKFKSQNIELIERLEENLPPLNADALQIEQAFLNILLNATQSMPNGGSLIVVSQQRHHASTPCIDIEFTDSGVGMDISEKKALFSPILSSSKEGGTGLGMAIVGKILEAHSASIEAQSEKNRGSTIRLSFPISEGSID